MLAFRPRFASSIVLPALLPLLALLASASPAGDETVAVDDQRSRWMDFGMGPVDPLVFTASGEHFWTVNQPGGRLLRVATDTLKPDIEAPAGLGIVSVALHPVRDELWLVDRVTGTVSVADPATGATVRSIPVGAEPHGIAFTETGDRAYVTCSEDNRVDVIDAASYTVVRSLPISARNPRGIVRVGDNLWVAAFLSGNGTAPQGNTTTGDTHDVRRVGVPDPANGETPLPDRDLFVIRIGATAAQDVIDYSAAVSGLGTILYAVRHRPGTSELWIPHTEANNAVFRGEKNFPSGQVVSNRIAIVDISSGAPDRDNDVQILDLDQLSPGPKLHAATPTDVAFSSDGSQAYVCSFGNHLVAVLDLSGPTPRYSGAIHLPPKDEYPDSTGPRSLAVSPDSRTLVTFNKGSNTLSRFALATLPDRQPFLVTAARAAGFKWDPIPTDIHQGRLHFNSARHSLSQTSSCGSCHVDGHTDGLVWDLGGFLDPEGTPGETLSFPIDAKGPLMTQSVRRLKEVGPYHWRGEKKELRDFDAAFIGLLEREEGGEPAALQTDFRYITQYMEHLAIPPNPRQDARRVLNGDEVLGRDLYLTKPVLDGKTCADCHPLPLGTGGEIVDNFGGLAPTVVVPSLRSVFDKLTRPMQIGGDFGRRTELGAGLGHSGAFATVEDLLLQDAPPPATGTLFDLSPVEADRLAAFVRAFDTGLAPAAAWQATVHGGNHAGFLAAELSYALEQATLGHSDLVYRYGPVDWMGEQRFLAGLYDPAQGVFLQPSTSLPPLQPEQVVDLALQGTPVTFMGVPGMMGLPLALDRDLDELFDLDELLVGTDPEVTDSDGDGYPDGYELTWGMDPLADDSSSPDDSPPNLVGSITTIFVTTNAVKVEFETDEPTAAVFAPDGVHPVLRAPLKPRHDRRFSEVVSELEPATYYQMRIELIDPDNNAQDVFVGFWTAPLVDGEPARVTGWSTLLTPGPGGPTFDATLTLGTSDVDPAPGYDLVTSLYYVSDDESDYRDLGSPPVTTNASGQAVLSAQVPASVPLGVGKLYAIVHGATAPMGWPPYVEADDVASFVAVPY